MKHLLFMMTTILIACSPTISFEGPTPNILLIVMDAARADHFSCYGYHRTTTPNIDRVAAEGLRFTRAVSTSSWTLPSHASLFTGLLPSENGTHIQHNWLIERIPTLAELLKNRGYRTAGFSSNPFVSEAHNLSRGFDTFKVFWPDSDNVRRNKAADTEQTNMLVRQFLESDVSSEKPFLVFINYMDVHAPYDPPEPYRTLFLSDDQLITAVIDSANRNPPQVNKGFLKLSDRDYEIIRSIYDGAFVFLDSKIGELLDYLKELNLYDNTLVIITSDHGEVFGEYGHFTHGCLLYRPLVQIPLIIRCPLLTGPAAVRHAPVSITDIFYTIVRLLDIEDAAAPTGAPASYLLGPGIKEKPCYSELKVDRVGERTGSGADKNDIRALWTARSRHYILSENESYECYDLAADPEETHNLCPSKLKKSEVVAALTGFESKLELFTESLEDLRSSRPTRIDPQHEAALRALGYVGGNEIDQIMQTVEEHPHVVEHLKTGIFFFRNDSLDAAEQEIRTVMKMSPRNMMARKYLGLINYKRGKYEKAIRMLRSVVGKIPNDENLEVDIASCLIRLNRFDEALKIYRQVSDENPQHSSAAICAAMIMLDKKIYADAEVYFRRVFESKGDKKYISNDQKEEKKYGLSLIKQYLNSSELDNNTRSAIAYLYLQSGRIEEAVEQYEILMEDRTFEEEALHMLGRINQQLKKNEKAKSYYNRILAKNPNHIATLVNMGMIERAEGRPEKAKEYYQLSLALDSTDISANFNLANLLVASGDQRLAERYFKIILKKYPKDSQTHLALAMLFLQDNSRYPEALKHFRISARLMPERAELIENRYIQPLQKKLGQLVKTQRLE